MMKAHQLVTKSTVCVLMMLAAGVVAQPSKSLRADLAGDSKLEKIEVRYSGKGESGDFYHIVVLDAEGNSIWSGPKVMDEKNPLVFGSWHHGASLPQAIGDIDGDGMAELIAPAPQSDVSPTTFRIISWTPNGFVPVKTVTYLAVDDNPEHFSTAKSEKYEGRWISAFESIEAGGKAKVEITEYLGGSGVITGRAIVTFDKDGATVSSWIKQIDGDFKVPTVSDKTSETSESVEENYGGDDGPLAVYVCQIGIEDLKNSQGGQLIEMQAVLTQDRANYHRFKLRHREDRPDEQYFKSPDNRLLFARVPIKATAKAQQTFTSGSAILHVTVYSDRVEVKLISE